MNCKEMMERTKSTYQIVKILSQKNGARVLQLRHRTLEKNLILRQYPEPVTAYDILKELRHPNLPEVYDSLCLADGQIVLEEYVEGLTVAEVLETGRYTSRGAKNVLRKVCLAVIALHGCGIIHRDIKPENVMVTASGEVKLMDLNASLCLTPERKQPADPLGTIGYAAYEQFGISRCDERTDVFALGILLNVMLTGEHPSRKLARGRLGKIVLKCTQIDPASRYQSAQKLLEAL